MRDPDSGKFITRHKVALLYTKRANWQKRSPPLSGGLDGVLAVWSSIASGLGIAHDDPVLLGVQSRLQLCSRWEQNLKFADLPELLNGHSSVLQQHCCSLVRNANHLHFLIPFRNNSTYTFIIPKNDQIINIIGLFIHVFARFFTYSLHILGYNK